MDPRGGYQPWRNCTEDRKKRKVVCVVPREQKNRTAHGDEQLQKEGAVQKPRGVGGSSLNEEWKEGK